MYRDNDQWLKIRCRILVEGIPRKQVAREAGMDVKTVRKMLAHPRPLPYGPRRAVYPKLGPYIGAVHQMLQEREASPEPQHFTSRTVFESIRKQGLNGNFRTVQRYLNKIGQAIPTFGRLPMVVSYHWINKPPLSS